MQSASRKVRKDLIAQNIMQIVINLLSGTVV